MDTFGQLAQKIIREQENIIGPLALEQAQTVPGLEVGDGGKEIHFKGDEKEIIETLVEKYRDLFGKASVEVCRDAARTFIPKLPKDKVPQILQ